ncbi:hypothetical protein GCM10022415_03090 [Knoellia locipacati]|uniref:Isoprenylcysteine carboxyl methyltransferase n=1 Tax=Knoellia locipacati TaxID=882824 RepID=A0A512SWD0_9MICO|nr:hypothetical protein KLO01_03080 [Knoellia locipacati]
MGRLILVPVFAALLVLNATKLLGAGTETHLLESAGTVTALAFYGVLVILYIRRDAATDTDRRWERWLVAGVATFSGFAIPLVGAGGTGSGLAAVGTALIVVGVGLSVWALLHLRTNISVVPQSRGLASEGPYRFFRHPLYVFEYISAIGLAIVNGGGWAWVVVAIIGVLQILRARWEEQLLRERVPGYAAYAERTRGFS